MTLSEKLIKLRTEKNLSQKQVADALGVHINTYSRVERGVNNLSAPLLAKLAKFYGVEAGTLSDAQTKETVKKQEKESHEQEMNNNVNNSETDI